MPKGYRTPNIQVKCSFCHTEFIAPGHKRTNKEHHFCNSECHTSWKAQCSVSLEHIAKRFWSKVNKESGVIMPHVNTECWTWTGAKTKAGYGHMVYQGQHVGAHRLILLLTLGIPLVDLDVVLHRCDNPPCCNPEHLIVGTTLDNIRDCKTKGRRAKIGARGELHGHAKLTEDSVVFIRSFCHNPYSPKELAKMFNVQVSTIRKVLQKESWKHVT